jgi:NRPS condensation-like uncharacterized protein
MTDTARSLSKMEWGIWRTDLGAPLNFTTVARVKGPLAQAHLRAALPALRERHQLLRSRIVPHPAGGATFRFDDVPPLSLRVVRGTSWVEELEREMNEPIAGDIGPLARFILVESEPGDCHVLVTLHHCIGDGMSGTFLVRDLVQAAALELAGQPSQLPALEVSGPMEARVPESAKRVGRWFHHLRFLLRELWLTLRHGKPVKVRRDQQAFSHSRTARVFPCELDAATTHRLMERARKEGTTVHGALSAAMLLGILADASLKRGCVAFGTPVNVRAALSPQVGQQVGFYISTLAYRGVVEAGMPFWELARRVRRSLEAELSRGDQLLAIDLLPRILRVIGGERLEPRALAEKWEQVVSSTSALTNLGRLTIETRHGPLSIDACHFAACPSSLGDFIASATSLGGRLFWNFVWTDPVFTRAHATELVDRICRNLQGALESPPG